MLEKLSTDLKKNLPAPLKKMLGGEEVIEEIENSSKLDKDEAKKKKTSMIIRVIVILALGFLALDELFLKEQALEISVDAGAEAKIATKKKARKKKLEEEKAKNKVESLSSQNSTETSKPNVDMNSTSAEEVPPVENINITPKAEEVVHSEIMKSDTIDEKLDKLNEEVPKEENLNVEPNASTSLEEVKVPSVGEEVIIKTNEKSEAIENKMTAKITEELVETPAPNYEQVGRGLVYNCKDKFWACVDKPAYISCNKNMKYNQKNGKTLQCSTVAIYANEDDCAKVQKYNVSVNEPTNFCGN